jgi:hypothetical protein
MAFRRQVQHQIRIGLLHRRRRGLPIGQIRAEQLIPPLSRWPQRLQHQLDAGAIAGIPELVEVEHLGLAVLQQMPHHRTADEAGPAGDQDALSRTQQLHSAGNGCGNHDSGQ